jgi:hypothetical protein
MTTEIVVRRCRKRAAPKYQDAYQCDLESLKVPN